MKKILFLKWNAYGNQYILKAWKDLGYECVIYDFPQKTEDTRRSEELAINITNSILANKVDIVFSFNYFPTVAIACKACQVKYVSWTYDSPFIQLYSRTIEYETNYAFVFDKYEYTKLRSLGVETVYFLPMAAPVEVYDSFKIDEKIKSKYEADVAMIGSMYTEQKHQLFRHFEKLDAYTKGYLDAVMEGQKQIYGATILESSLSSEIVEKIQKVCPIIANGDGYETVEWVIANYFLARKITSVERQEMIAALSDMCKMVLYTNEATPSLPKVINRGTVDYYTEAPYAIKSAKINLNISLRSIVSGIPLRAFDIMGCGGFLLTNYQSDFLEFFNPDEDFVYFESVNDLKEKVEYYLNHDEDRLRIAESGYKKTREYHTFDSRLRSMLEILD